MRIGRTAVGLRSNTVVRRYSSFTPLSSSAIAALSRTPMRLAMGTNALILVLDPTLIYGLGFGVRGAATATVASRVVLLTVGWVLVRRRSLAVPPVPPVPLAAAENPEVPATPLPRRATRVEALEVARARAPLGGDFIIRMTGATALATVVATFGVAAVAAYGIGTKAMYFVSMAFYAVRQAATIHTARSDPEQASHIARATVAVGVSLGVVAALVYAGAAPWIMAAFTDKSDVTAVGVGFLRWLALYLVPISAVIGLSGTLATGPGRSRLLLVTGGGTVALVALARTLAGPYGLAGVWAAMCGSAVLQCAALLLLLRRLGAGDRLRAGRPLSAGTRP